MNHDVSSKCACFESNLISVSWAIVNKRRHQIELLAQGVRVNQLGEKEYSQVDFDNVEKNGFVLFSLSICRHTDSTCDHLMFVLRVRRQRCEHLNGIYTAEREPTGKCVRLPIM